MSFVSVIKLNMVPGIKNMWCAISLNSRQIW